MMKVNEGNERIEKIEKDQCKKGGKKWWKEKVEKTVEKTVEKRAERKRGKKGWRKGEDRMVISGMENVVEEKEEGIDRRKVEQREVRLKNLKHDKSRIMENEINGRMLKWRERMKVRSFLMIREDVTSMETYQQRLKKTVVPAYL